MSRLLLVWFDICLLRAGPQDLPASRELLGLAIASYTLVSFLLSAPGYPLATAGQMALVDVALLIVFPASLLYLLGKPARVYQTLTALAGTGTLLGLIALPVMPLLLQGEGSGPPPVFASLLWLVLFGWTLMVVAHIMRHALSVNLPVAIGIAVVYSLLAMQIIAMLFPATAA
jgi:hypothetical protein